MSDRKKSFWPLPGEPVTWIEKLKELLAKIRDEHHTLETLAEWAENQYQKGKWMKKSLQVALLYTGLAEERDGGLKLSNVGAKFLESNDPEVVLDALITNIWGIREVMFWLKEGATDVNQLFERCIGYGVSWRRSNQVYHRLQWLSALGAVVKIGSRYTLSQIGLRKVEEMRLRGLKPEPLIKRVETETFERMVETRAKYEGMPAHADLQNALLELGRLEGYEVAKEYPIDDERLDVAWWRRGRKKPDIVFEIQRAGNFYAALTKLKEAWDLWECRVALVTSEEYLREAARWLKSAFHEMENYSRIVLWKEVMKWMEASKIRDQMRKKLSLP